MPKKEKEVLSNDEAAQEAQIMKQVEEPGSEKEDSAQIGEVDVLKQTVTDLQAKLDAAVAEAKAHQAVATKKAQELRALETRPPVDEDDLSVQETTLRILKNRQDAYGEPDPEIARLEAALVAKKQQKEVQRRMQEQQKIVSSEREKIQQRITEAKLDPEDEQFDAMWDAFDYAADNTGNFEKANKRLERVLGKTKSQEEKPKVNKEEEERKKLDKADMLQSDTHYPGASLTSDEQFVKDYSEGKSDDHERANKLMGLYPTK